MMKSTPSIPLQVLLLSLGKTVAAISSVLITMILTRFLSLDDYATHKQALLIFALIKISLAFEISASLSTYI